MPTTETTLGDLVTEQPQAARVLHRFGLDYCCGGHRTIGTACEEKGVDPRDLLRQVEEEAAPAEPMPTWDLAPLDELIQHILTRYHQPLREELPRLVTLAERVERRHGDKAECPVGLSSLLREVMASVESHLTKEEKILFPAIEAGRGSMARMPIRAMIHEHEDHGRNLVRIRQITNDLDLPPSACATWRELYRALGELEVDLMDHIHLENNILFPRALRN
jgi:regulator of cell morphogenesis and NO signaling